MNIFEYLLTDERHIQEKLHDVAEHYSDWPQTKVFDGVRHGIDSINGHIEKVNLTLLQGIPDKIKFSDLLAKWKERTASIEDSINSLTQLHVDEPGFEQLFIHLTKAFDTLTRFAQEELFPTIKKNSNEDVLDQMNAKLESMVFS